VVVDLGQHSLLSMEASLDSLAAIIARVMSKFAAAYTEGPSEWYDFLSWGVVKGHWPTLPSMK